MPNESMPPVSRGPTVPQNDTEAASSSVGKGYVFFLGQRLALVVGVSDDEDHGDGQSDQQHTDRVDHHPLADERRILLFTTTTNKSQMSFRLFALLSRHHADVAPRW